MTYPRCVNLLLMLATISCLDAQCPTKCKCIQQGVGFDVFCTNITSNITPDFPRNTTKLTLSKSSFSTISVRSLSGLTNLTELTVENCSQFSRLESGSFTNLNKLEMIRFLNLPKLSELNYTIFLGASSLYFLELQDTSLLTLSGALFLGVNLTWLQVTGKTVEGINSDTFSNLGSLETLILTRSNRSGLPDGLFQYLPHLKNLVLAENKLSSIPTNAFKGLHALEKLDLSDNLLTVVNTGAFPGEAFNLTELDLTGNKLQDLSQIPVKEIPKLSRLVLASNEFSVIKNNSFNDSKDLQHLFLDNMPSLTSLEDKAFAQLLNLETLSLSQNPNLQTITASSLNIKDISRVADLSLQSNGIKALDETIFTSKPGLKTAKIHDNKYQCDCAVFGIRLLMDNTAAYTYAESWKGKPLGPICQSPERFKGRYLYELDTRWDLACGLPEIKYRSPAVINAIEKGQTSLLVYFASTWALTMNWTIPSGDILSSPSAKMSKQDSLTVTNTTFPNGTQLANLTIEKITDASAGNYVLQIENQRGHIRLDMSISVNPPPSTRLGGIETMVIIISVAIGLLFGALAIGMHHKEKRERERRMRDEERQSLISSRR